MTNVLSVGRLEERNGIGQVIDAFGLVARRRTDLRLLVAGEGPMRARYEAQTARLPRSVAERVVFLGAVWEERPDLYATAHCLALGARKTSFSILLLEALATGLRVAAVPGEGTARAGEHWMLAEMAQAEAPEAFAEALERALAPRTPDYVARARQVARRHDWSRIAPRIRRVYEEALGVGPAC